MEVSGGSIHSQNGVIHSLKSTQVFGVCRLHCLVVTIALILPLTHHQKVRELFGILKTL